MTTGRGRFTLGILKRLTPDGRQFLRSAKNEALWRRTKRDFVRPGLFFSLRLVADYLRQKDGRVIFGDDVPKTDDKKPKKGKSGLDLGSLIPGR